MRRTISGSQAHLKGSSDEAEKVPLWTRPPGRLLGLLKGDGRSRHVPMLFKVIAMEAVQNYVVVVVVVSLLPNPIRMCLPFSFFAHETPVDEGGGGDNTKERGMKEDTRWLTTLNRNERLDVDLGGDSRKVDVSTDDCSSVVGARWIGG